MTLSLRLMLPDDNAALLAVVQQCVLEFGYPHSPYITHPEEADLYGDMHGESSRMYVLLDATGQIVGGGGFAPVLGAEGYCEIQKVYFLPKARGLGWGKRLVKRLMDEAAELGYTHYYIESVPEMTGAIALYESLGFVPCNRHSTDGHNVCTVYMQRPVDERKRA